MNDARRPDPPAAEVEADAVGNALDDAGGRPLNAQDRAHCAAMAALLHAGTNAPPYGWRVLLAAVAWLLLGVVLTQGHRLWATPALPAGAAGLLILAALLGLLQRVHLFRMRFDERLFAAMAQGHIGTLDALDSALLLTTGRRRNTGGAPRDLLQRIEGTRALLRRAALTLLAQTATIVLAVMLLLFSLRGLTR